MFKFLIKSGVLFGFFFMLTGCLSSLWTGATLIYDRHHLYKSANDFKLVADARRALYKDDYFKRSDCLLDLAAFHGDLLLAGHLPSTKLRDLAIQRVRALGGFRRFFDQISVHKIRHNEILDSWISAKIRAKILADSSIDPNAFKIITIDQMVYVMGDVLPQQGNKILKIASSTTGVKRVIKLLQYYHLAS